MHRSTDGGRTWQALPYRLLDNSCGCVQAVALRPDGALLVELDSTDNHGRLLVSTDQGTSFTQLPLARDAEAYPVPGGFALSIPLDSVQVSTDMVHWQLVPLPSR